MTLTVTPLLGVSRFPLSSTARLIRVVVPTVVGVHVALQGERPVAGCHVLPPSPENSTPPTAPPESVAVPVTVIEPPVWIVELDEGEVIVETGGVVSVEALAETSPGCNVEG
jgi:hypothetical protein